MPHPSEPHPLGLPARLVSTLRRLTARAPLEPGPATDSRRAAPALALPRLILTIVPAMLILGIAASTVWGSSGLFTRHALAQEASRAAARLARLDRENQRLLRELALMDTDPVVLERMVAEELMLAREGATIYVFEGEPAPR